MVLGKRMGYEGGRGKFRRVRDRRPSRSRYTRRRSLGRQLSRARYGLGIKNVGTQGLLGLETNYTDYSIATTALTTNMSTGMYDPAGGINCLNGVTQGDGPTNRTGNKITLKSIEIEGMITVAAQEVILDPPISPTIFIALVLDTQTNGAQCTSDQIYGAAAGILAASPIRNMSFTERFRVLKKLRMNLPAFTMSQNGANSFSLPGNQVPFKIFKKLRGLVTSYQTGNTTNQIAGIVDNSLHVVAWTSDTSTVDSIVYQARLRFWG